MLRFILMIIFSLTLMACDRQGQPTDPSPKEFDYDNTGINIRDRNLSTKTPLDQSDSEFDRELTKKK